MSRHAYYTQRNRDDRRDKRRRDERPWYRRFGLDVLKARWTNAMPKFFRTVCWLSALVGGTALAVNTAITSGGGTTHEWWNDIYPYLLGIPAGAAFVAKFTQNYDKHGNPVKHEKDKDKCDPYNDSDVETHNATQHPEELDPYNDD